jgi:predicted MFS family arabinose efflux permease
MTQAADERAPQTQLAIIFITRTAINTTFRIIYPFLPSIARGLGISLKAAGALVSLRMAGRLTSPFLGPLADRYGRRRVMEIALLLFSLASLLLAGLGTFAAAAVAFILYGVAKALYDPAIYAYLGDTVPYHKRGRTIGAVELAWSSAWLLGVPASGFLIDRFGWRAPWTVLIVLGLLGLWLTRANLPPAARPGTDDGGGRFVASLAAAWRDLLRRRSVVALLLVSLFSTVATEVTFIVYGAWIETTFGLSVSALGVASIVVGLAEAAAEFSAAAFTDRLGKRRSVLLGMLGLTASLVALPWLSGFGLAAALLGIVLMMLTFEFALVSLLPLATELAPDARASLLALALTAFGLARVLGAFIGGWLWQWQRIALHAGLGAVCALIAALLMARGVVEIE